MNRNGALASLLGVLVSASSMLEGQQFSVHYEAHPGTKARVIVVPDDILAKADSQDPNTDIDILINDVPGNVSDVLGKLSLRIAPLADLGNLSKRPNADCSATPDAVAPHRIAISLLRSGNAKCRPSEGAFAVAFVIDGVVQEARLIIGSKAHKEIPKTTPQTLEEYLAQSGIDNNQYSEKSNLVVLYYDSLGSALFPVPVNVDQDDRFEIHIIHLANQRFEVKQTEGDFVPTSLRIERTETPVAAEGEREDEAIPWTQSVRYFGPFTTDHFGFSIRRTDPGAGEAPVNETHRFSIDPLYDVSFKIALVHTDLIDRAFRVAPRRGGPDSTITSTNGKERGVVVFQAVFYNWFWLGRGIDPIKESKVFPHIYPTLGVALSDKVFENFFGGFNIDVARGFSVTGGVHFGKVHDLAERFQNRRFRINQDPFSGPGGIQTTDEWQTGVFVGASIDIRVFNGLFKRQ